MSSIVASITGQRGGNSGGAGLNYNADRADLINPTTAAQANEQYANVGRSLSDQEGFLNAVNAQNGLGNQTSVYNQLQGVANGTGPNPAQAQLAQATSANTANQAALMAGQRGAGSNPALIARQAAMQGAQNQQNAAGQAATMQANQSLNAINGMGQIANQQAAQQGQATQAFTNATQGEQQNILGGIAAQNNAQVGAVSSQNSANAGVSGAAVKGQSDLIGNLAGGAGAAFMAQGGQIAPQKMADGGVSASPQQGPKSRAGQFFQQMSAGQGGVPQQQSQLQGTAAAGNAIGKGLGMGIKSLFSSRATAPGASNADISAMNAQQMSGPSDPMFDPNRQSMPGSDASDYTSLSNDTPVTPAPDMSSATSTAFDLSNAIPMEADGGMMDTIAKMAPMIAMMAAAKGGKVPALVSPGERYLSPDKVAKVAEGKADPIKDGKKVPGKPKVAGAKNSYANDTVPAQLDPGGIVIPRNITQGKNPGHEAKKFVEAILAKNAKSLPAKGK